MTTEEDQIIRIQWIPDPSSSEQEVEGLARYLRERGADTSVEKGAGLFGIDDAVLVIVAAMGIVKLADSIVDVAKNTRYGGLIIDGSTRRLSIKETNSIPRGQIVYINPKKKAEILGEAKTPDDSLFRQLVDRVLKVISFS